MICGPGGIPCARSGGLSHDFKMKGRFVFLCLLALCLLVLYYWYGCSYKWCRQEKRGEQRHQDEVAPPISGETSVAVTSRQEATTSGSSNIINPGCKEKKLNKYRPIDMGQEYHYPSIVHYAKLTWGGNSVSLNFREYTSVLSVYKFLQPERIIFHTNTDMVGKYWDQIKSWRNVQVEVKKIPRVRSIGGRNVGYIQHEADYVKLRALYNYGGVTLDFDVVIVNGTKLKQEQKISECVLSEEGEYINGGFHSCIQHSSFIAKWLEGYDHDYKPELWLHNVSYKPTALLTGKDSTVCYNVYLDDTISIKPHWGKQKEWLKNKVQWRTKTAAHYFVKTGIKNDNEQILKENHSLAELLRYVHEA